MADPKTNGPDGAQLLRRAEEAIDAAGDAVEAAVLHIERPAGERLRIRLEDVKRPLQAALDTPTQPGQGERGELAGSLSPRVRMLRYAAESIEPQFYGFAGSLRELADELAASTQQPSLDIDLEGQDADVITVYRRMEAAAEGARAERDIMRAAVEEISTYSTDDLRAWHEENAVDMVEVARKALAADRKRREDNLAALSDMEGRNGDR